MDGGAWKAAVHEVGEGRTRLRDFTFTFHFHALEKEMATHSNVLPGESQGWGNLLGCRLMGRTESDTTEATAAAAEVTNCHLQRKRGKLSAKLPLQELLG